MSLIDNLNTLDTNIEEERGKLLTNLSNKGVTVQPTDTLSVMVDNVKNIEAGGINWEDVGYDEEPKPIADKHKLIAQWYSEWNPANTQLTGIFTGKHPECDIFPLIDTSNVTSMEYAFDSNTIEYIPSLDTSKVYNMQDAFYYCSSLKEVSTLDTSKVKYMGSMFNGCSSLTKTPVMDISSCTSMTSMFQDCTNLKEIWFKGQPQSNINLNYMFYNVTTTGTLYYDHRYNYSNIIAVIPSTWTAQAWNYDTNSPA